MLFIFIREPKDYQAQEERPSMFGSLKEIIRNPDSSALRILFAIFFWFIGYNAIEAFFSLYVNKYLGLEEAEGARLLSQLSLFFVLLAIPAGKLGATIGRRKTISLGLILISICVIAIFLLPASVLTTELTKLPVLGVIPVLGLILMVAGISWALININSLPMVVDMTEPVRIGTFTGLYYLFSTLAAIAGPNLMGWVVTAANNNYNAIMVASPIFFIIALILMLGVKSGEAKKA
jgi:MFS-type transporter involved in bile tolerance (Atg22 family)